MAPLYDLLTTAGSALAIPALYLGSVGDPARRLGLHQRLGTLPSWPGARGFWLQAVSVGEVRQARTFLQGLGEISGGKNQVALSSTTPAGRQMARELGVEMVFAFPLDVPWIIRRALDHLKPTAYGTIETELWPGLLAACGSRGIPAFIVNGSISPRSAARWRWMSRTIGQGLSSLRAACMQTQQDAERLLQLGAPASAVEVTGDLKFDGEFQAGHEATASLRSLLAIPEATPVIVAGSTAPGEEAAVVRAWIAARSSIPALRLLVAPRHPHRFEEAAREIESAGVPVNRRSRIEPGAPPPTGAVILLDTLGELEAAYGLGWVAFVGGSLAPRGGQNPLEPARLGVPVLFGPGMKNFREIADGLTACGAAREVEDEADLSCQIIRLLGDDSAWKAASKAGPAFLHRHAGSTSKTLDALSRKIPEVFS